MIEVPRGLPIGVVPNRFAGAMAASGATPPPPLWEMRDLIWSAVGGAAPGSATLSSTPKLSGCVGGTVVLPTSTAAVTTLAPGLMMSLMVSLLALGVASVWTPVNPEATLVADAICAAGVAGGAAICGGPLAAGAGGGGGGCCRFWMTACWVFVSRGCAGGGGVPGWLKNGMLGDTTRLAVKDCGVLLAPGVEFPRLAFKLAVSSESFVGFNVTVPPGEFVSMGTFTIGWPGALVNLVSEPSGLSLPSNPGVLYLTSRLMFIPCGGLGGKISESTQFFFH